MIICPECGRHYETRRPEAVFCSDLCRTHSYQRWLRRAAAAYVAEHGPYKAVRAEA